MMIKLREILNKEVKMMSDNKEHELKIKEVIHQATAVSFANRLVKVNGTRHNIPLDGREIEIVYYKAPSEASDPAPLIVGFHGGGFIFGGCALDNIMWTRVSNVLNVNIASIGYRQSPDHMWRDCLDDCYDSLVYLASHSEEFGFDPEHISVMGQSAGGNLAAAVTLKNNETQAVKLDNQILVYPLLDMFTDPDEKGEGSFAGEITHIMNELHIKQEESNDPFASPAFATEQMVLGSPKTIIIYCELDNLRHEAISYAAKLRNAGVNVSDMIAKDMPHGFFETGFKDRITDMEFEFLGATGREIYESGLLRKRSEEALNFIRSEFVLQ